MTSGRPGVRLQRSRHRRLGTADVRRAIGATILAAIGLPTTGCHPNDPHYFPAETILQTDGTATEVQETLALKFRVPTAAEQAEVDKLTAQLGYPVPWLREDRVHLEIRYTVTNMGGDPGTFSLFVDGATEFTRFDYQAIAAVFMTARQDPPPVGLIATSSHPILAPGQVFQGTTREDDFHEGSLDLDAMGRFMAPFVAVLINRSEVNPVGLDMVPNRQSPPQQWILPALWEITPRFSATQPMTLQFIVRVRDDNQRLWDNGDDEFMPNVTTFTPVLPPRP